ncbi:hypothetical protein ABZX12_04210 [Kribbella sp. NPDC003505]|uniref:hypothetical protein n=1 Tax=Kribbella sp. NPDC003505 TaxID=3154448 RepID=UPI0033A16B98
MAKFFDAAVTQDETALDEFEAVAASEAEAAEAGAMAVAVRAMPPANAAAIRVRSIDVSFVARKVRQSGSHQATLSIGFQMFLAPEDQGVPREQPGEPHLSGTVGRVTYRDGVETEEGNQTPGRRAPAPQR